MQINIEKNLVEFTPENADESAKLQTLWRVYSWTALASTRRWSPSESTYPEELFCQVCHRGNGNKRGTGLS